MKNSIMHTLKLEKGDSVIDSIVAYAKKYEIKFAKVQMFGAVTNLTLGFLLESGEYKYKKFEDKSYELLPCMGSLAWHDGEVELHLHGSVATQDYQVIGGHIKEMDIFGVGEVFITELSQKKMVKAYDERTKLMLWDMK